MKIDLQLRGLDGVLATLQSLPAEVVSKRGGPVRAALRKGARVIHKQELANLQAVLANATESGKRESTGLLIKNVVVTRGKEPAGTKGERYLVRVRRKSYPRKEDGKPVTTLKSAQLLEYGSSKQPAEPWIRPAFAARAEQAIATVQDDLLKSIQRITTRLARENAGK